MEFESTKLYNRLLLHMLFEISIDLAIMLKLCSSATLYLYTLSVIPYCNPENL